MKKTTTVEDVSKVNHILYLVTILLSIPYYIYRRKQEEKRQKNQIFMNV